MRDYFARMTDVGIEVRFIETHQMGNPNEWRPVPNIRQHVNAKGLQTLHAFRAVLFDAADQSYPALATLFVPQGA